MPNLALALCGLAAIGLLSIGTLALVSPERLSRSYGIPVQDPAGLAFVRATGARDLLIGLIFATGVYFQDALQLLILCAIGVLLSAADFTIAFFSNGRTMRSEYAAHIGGAVAFAVLIALLARQLHV